MELRPRLSNHAADTNVCSHAGSMPDGADGTVPQRAKSCPEVDPPPDHPVCPPRRPSLSVVEAIDATSGDDPDLHPRPGRAQFLPRLSQGQQALVPLLYQRGIRATVSPLYYAQHNPELSLLPTVHRMGNVLDPCTQIRQKPWSQRAAAFRALAFGNDPEPYLPDSAELTDEELVALATGPIDAARGRGGTILLTTFHLAGPIGTRGRDIELLLAELGIRHFREQRIDEPPPLAAVEVRREIYATIAVSLADLTSARARLALADAYLDLGADGLWVKIAGLHEKASDAGLRAAGAFFAALHESDKPVVSCGAGQLHLALLVEELSASIGIGESERFVIPSTWPTPEKGAKRRGRTRMAYHPKYHASFRVGSPEATAAFRQAPCTCGVHGASKPPTGLLVGDHAAILRAEQAAEALTGTTEERREWLLGSATKASWAADDAGITGRHTSLRKYEALFEGLDAENGLPLGQQVEL